MTTSSESLAPEMSLRVRLMQFFLWVSVIGWGIGFGAKLFDLIIVAGAWGASPPTSLALMPYGPRYPMNPGDFFQPLSVLMTSPLPEALSPRCGLAWVHPAEKLYRPLARPGFRVLSL